MAESNSETVDAAQKEPEEDGKPSLHYWRSQLDAYDNAALSWKKDVDRAWDEYLNESGRGKTSQTKRDNTHFPLFWSCVRTIQPAFYSRTPVLVTEKTFKEMKDPVAALSAIIIERLGRYLVKTSGFDRTMSLSTTHFIMSEKITNRVIFESGISETQVPYEGPDGQMMMQTEEDLDYLNCETETWHYKDARHTPNARHWGEIDWLSFDTQMRRQEVEDVFGVDTASQLTFAPMGSSGDKNKKPEIKGLPSHFATITEIWDKKKRRVYYLAAGYGEWLTHKNNPKGEDPYKLHDFFPCPPFMLGTFGADDLFTVPAYIQLADFIEQVHGAFDRVRRLVLALKKAGIYDASKPELAELNNILSEGQFIGVGDLDKLLGEAGTLAGLIHFFPTDEIAKGVNELKTVMMEFEQKVYDLWGIPDIYRGISDPNETLGAQQLKGKHMSVRFSVLQREIQRLARDTIEIMIDLFLQKAPELRIAEIVGYKFMSPTQQPLFYQALQLAKDDKERCIRIGIETDSTITQDMNADIEQKNYLNKTLFEGLGALKEIDPKFMPVAAKAVEMGVRSLREGKQIEDDLDVVLDQMMQAAQQPPPPEAPDPRIQIEQMKLQQKQAEMQQDAQKFQMELQVQQGEQGQLAQQHQIDVQIEMQKLQVAAQETMAQVQLEREKLAIEMEKLRIAAQTEGMKSALDAQAKKSDQAIELLRVEIEQYKAVLSEKEKLLEERRLSHEDNALQMERAEKRQESRSPQAMPVFHIHAGDKDGKPKRRKLKITQNEDGNTADIEEIMLGEGEE